MTDEVASYRRGADAPEGRTPPRQRPWDKEVAVPLPAQAGFTAQEHWAWAKIIRGEPADMSQALYDTFDGVDVTPADEGEWPDRRVLSARFLETILFHEPWASARAKPWVRITRAWIKDDLSWQNQRFADEIALQLCRMNALDCIAFTLGNDLVLNGSTVFGHFDGDRMKIAGSLLLRHGFDARGRFDLNGVEIGGQVSMVGAHFSHGADLSDAHVRGSVYFREGSSCKEKFDFITAVVDGDVQFLGPDTEIDAVVNFTGAKIRGEVAFDQGGEVPARWGANSTVILRNAELGALSGAFAAFSRSNEKGKRETLPVDLTGLTYHRLGGLAGVGAHAGQSLADAKPHELRALLTAYHKKSRAFTPQPYRQLARALGDAGHRAKADAVLKALADHELSARNVPLSRKIGLFFSKHLVMYGHGAWRAAVLFLAVVALGAVYGLEVTGGLGRSIEDIISWSRFALGNATPFLTLDEAHKDFLSKAVAGPGETVKLVFDAQKMLGYLLLSYLVAGLSGLASKPEG